MAVITTIAPASPFVCPTIVMSALNGWVTFCGVIFQCWSLTAGRSTETLSRPAAEIEPRRLFTELGKRPLSTTISTSTSVLFELLDEQPAAPKVVSAATSRKDLNELRVDI